MLYASQGSARATRARSATVRQRPASDFGARSRGPFCRNHRPCPYHFVDHDGAIRARKGFLRRRKANGLHLYSPTLGKAEFLRGLVAEFVDASLEGAVSPFVAYLSQSSLLTPAEARKIEELLKRLEAREKEGA